MTEYCRFSLRLKYFFKKLFRLPIYRKDVLKYACENSPRHYNDILWAVKDSLIYFGFDYIPHCLSVYEIFPEFGNNIGLFVGFDTNVPYWWDSYEWQNKMKDYFEWLIEFYQYDKTNLRKIEHKAREKFG